VKSSSYLDEVNPMKTIIIKNVKLVTPQGTLYSAIVTIQDGKIVHLHDGRYGHPFPSPHSLMPQDRIEVIDGSGNILLPGLIDAHVHFREPGLTHKEDFFTGSCAAVSGGITTIIDMPNTKPPMLTIPLLEEKRRLAEKSVVNYGFHFGSSASNLNDIAQAQTYPGVASTKVFLNESTGKMMVQDQEALYQIFLISKLITTHAEGEKINLALELHEDTDTPVYFCHLSSKDDVELIRKAKQNNMSKLKQYETSRATALRSTWALARETLKQSEQETRLQEQGARQHKGQRIFAEVSPHHLFLSSGHFNAMRGFAMMKPSLKEMDDKDALWEAISDGTIDTIASDHAPHTIEEKRARQPPFGCPGVETLLPLMLHAVSEGRLTLKRLVELCCENPARIFGIEGKGKIAVGYDADFVLVDVEKEKRVENEKLLTKCGWSPFNHWTLKGWPVLTIVHGNIVYDDREEKQQIFTQHTGKEIACTSPLKGRSHRTQEERSELSLPERFEEPEMLREEQRQEEHEELQEEMREEEQKEKKKSEEQEENLTQKENTPPEENKPPIVTTVIPLPAIQTPPLTPVSPLLFPEPWDQDVFNNFMLQQGVIGVHTESITLASGRKSNWYANCRTLLNTFKRIHQLSDFVLAFAKEKGLEFDYFFGVPEGATKLADVLNFKRGLLEDQPQQRLVMGRAKPKEHGSVQDKYFIGEIKEGDKVLVIEDVTTTGQSLIKTIGQLKEAGAIVVGALALVDRMEKRDDGVSVEQALSDQGVLFFRLSKGTELLKRYVQEKEAEKGLVLDQNVLKQIEVEFTVFGVEPLEFSTVAKSKQTTLVEVDQQETKVNETLQTTREEEIKKEEQPTFDVRSSMPQKSWFSYLEQLKDRTEETKNIICMGMDPLLEKIPLPCNSKSEEQVTHVLTRFYLDMLRAMEGENTFPALVKPNIAYFEQYGFAGLRALKMIISAYQQKGIPVLIDAKRGDIGTTAGAYAKSLFDFWKADAITVNPYFGHDGVRPFLEYCEKGKGVYILCRTSNDGARDFQDLYTHYNHADSFSIFAGKRLYLQVAQKIVDWKTKFAPQGGVGAVVGATYPQECEHLSEFFVQSKKEIPLLIPGIGTQGGSPAEVIEILKKTHNDPKIHRINASSSINYAYRHYLTTDYAGAAVKALKDLNKQIVLG